MTKAQQNLMSGLLMWVLAIKNAGVAQNRQPPPWLARNVNIKRDINYAGTNNPAQTLDVLRPNKPSEKVLPVIVAIHGGGFRTGDKANEMRDIAPLVARGNYAGVTINYRLSGEAIWPAQIHDCKAAIRWVRANAKEYGFDPDRIGVIGRSAGGHLVAMLGTSGGVEKLEGEVGPHKGVSSRVQCVVDLFGSSDLLAAAASPRRQKFKGPDSPAALLLGGPLQQNKELARAASPITYVTKDAPPFFLAHGDRDPIVPYDQSVILHKALKDAGASSLFVTVRGGQHGFYIPEIARRIGQFFDKNLRGKDETISEAPVPNIAQR